MGILSEELQKISLGRLTSLGFKVTFGGHIGEMNEFESSPISQRIEDMHAAFLDKNVKAVLTVIGGFNSNQLLNYIDFGVIRKNPKIFCGFSDITALQNAILKKSSLISYNGRKHSRNQFTIWNFRIIFWIYFAPNFKKVFAQDDL